jgi:hypothetical protein
MGTPAYNAQQDELRRLKAAAEDPKATPADKVKYMRAQIEDEKRLPKEAEVRKAGDLMHNGNFKELEAASKKYKKIDEEEDAASIEMRRVRDKLNGVSYGSPKWKELKDQETALATKRSDIWQRKAEAEVAFRKVRDKQPDRVKANYAKVRPMGATGLDTQITPYVGGNLSGYATSGKATKDVKAVRDAMDHYPTAWAEASAERTKGSPFSALRIAHVDRGFHSDAYNAIALSGTDPVQLSTVAYHELGHRFEQVVKGVGEAEEQYFKSRTKGETAKWLGGGYRRDELSKFDKWMDAYMGKEYSASGRKGQAYEQLSMATGYIYTGEGYSYGKLPEDLDFIKYYEGVLALY